METFNIMQISILDGRTVILKLRKKHLRAKSRSQFQHEIGQQLEKQYPHDQIFEEVFIPIENLVFDFFIPSLHLVIECMGIQHSQHIKHFHKTKQAFHQQQNRDQRKRDLCFCNGFKLIEIYDE